METAVKPRPSYEAGTRPRPSQEVQPSGRPSQEVQSSGRPSQDTRHRRHPSKDVETRRQQSQDTDTRRPSQDPESRRRPSQDIERKRRPSQDPEVRSRPSQEIANANRVKPALPLPPRPTEDPQNRNRPSLEAERKRRRILYGVDPPPPAVAGPSQPRDARMAAIRFNEGTSNGHSESRIHQAPSADEYHTQESTTRLSHEKHIDELPSFMPTQNYVVQKERSPEEIKFRKSMRKRRMRILTISSLIVLLLLIAIILLVRVVRPRIRHSVDNIGQDASSNLSQAQTQCVETFRNDGLRNPKGYSCSSCLPALRSVSQQYLDNPANAARADDINAAVQFCGLRAVFDSANQDGQNALTSSGWLNDIKTCTWGGVTCDDSGAITQLNLQSPSVPQSIPEGFSAIKSLSQLHISGDSNLPSGQVNSNLPSSLKDLQLFNTSLQGFSGDDLFQANGSLANLVSLTMDNNPNMGSTLPQSLYYTNLQTLVVRNQHLSISINELGTSSSFAKSLVTLDLSHNDLSGNLTLVYLPRLVTLDLSFNNLEAISDQFSFPSSLQTVSFQNNPQLHGLLSPAFCNSTWVTNCNFQSTQFSTVTNITCGSCQF
ncbi:L domain-like protein [Serendipita vermifera]|nr:L domain-like protein [Serendipita vermifera]